MSAEEISPLLQTCEKCGTVADMSEELPLTRVACAACGGEMTVQRKFPNFTLLELIGQGGMGAVYKALDTNLQRHCAVKLLNKEFGNSPESVDKLVIEAKIMASINHPNVVKVYSSGFDHGQFYIVMELVSQGSLDDLMTMQERISEVQVLEIGLQVASGLAAAHQQGLVHRDIKPGNILFSGAHVAKVVDFGLAKFAAHENDASGEIWGTPYYIPPETLNREPEDFRSDIYSLGATLFHAVAGRPPFEAESASLVAIKHLKSQPVSLKAFAPDVADETAYIINRMLAKNPDDRFNSYEDLIEHFQYALGKVRDTSWRPQRAEDLVVTRDRKSRRLFALFGVIMFVLLISASAGLFLFRDFFLGLAHDPNSPENRYLAFRKTFPQLAPAEARTKLVPLAALKFNDPAALQWVVFHQGLAELMDGNNRDANKYFSSLYSNRSIISSDPKNRELGNFFVETGRFVIESPVIRVASVNDFNENTLDALSLLAFGLKDWNAGQFDDAAKILRRFVGGTNDGDLAWIAAYKPFAQGLLDNYDAYTRILSLAAAAQTKEQATKALEEIRKLKASVQRPPQLIQNVVAREQELEKKAAGP